MVMVGLVGREGDKGWAAAEGAVWGSRTEGGWREWKGWALDCWTWVLFWMSLGMD